MVSDDRIFTALGEAGKGLPVEEQADFPSLSHWLTPATLQKIAQKMVNHHLVLTYGRVGARAALAHTLFAQLYDLPPLIHHEDGSDETARERRGPGSTWVRRLGLGKAAGLVVPGETMEREALVRWHQPFGRVKTIRDGIDFQALPSAVKPDAIPRLVKRPGERWIACIARPRLDEGPDEGLHAIVEALSTIDPGWHLVISGEGSGQTALKAKVSALGLDDRVHVIAPLADPAPLIVLSDAVAIPGGVEPLPRTAVLAMAAGKLVFGFETGELAASLSPDNIGFIAPSGDRGGLRRALEQLSVDDFLRQRTGEANRERARAERDFKTTLAAYRRLYASAMGREGA